MVLNGQHQGGPSLLEGFRPKIDYAEQMNSRPTLRPATCTTGLGVHGVLGRGFRLNLRVSLGCLFIHLVCFVSFSDHRCRVRVLQCCSVGIKCAAAGYNTAASAANRGEWQVGQLLLKEMAAPCQGRQWSRFELS